MYGLYEANLESFTGRKQVEAKVSIYPEPETSIYIYIYIYIHIVDCFSWMIPSDLYVESDCLNKHIHFKLVV